MDNIKARYEVIADSLDDLETQIELIRESQAELAQRLKDLERKWLETHSCSCGLLGVECTHEN